MFIRCLVISLIQTVGSVLAVQYVPTSIDSQIQSSDAVIRASYQGREFKKSSDGLILTESSFKVVSSSGLGSSELLNTDAFKVIHPGGEWGGVKHHIPGGPQFKQDEEVILLLTKTSDGHVLHNLGMGKYKIVMEGNKEFVKSTVFGDHPSFGKMSLEDFNKELESRFGEALKSVKDRRFVYKKPIEKNVPLAKTTEDSSQRNPASLEDTSEERGHGRFNFFWLTLILAVLGAIFILFTRQKDD
ncbi:MAG: hypothetical protein H6622_02485 [Halobacteriovoraceae bacterium]|nr:hypothetical protein [Halobacteriovoraceae bacterium]